MQHVFIIGSKGIPARYGGFETFVENLVLRNKSKDIKYYVFCLAERSEDDKLIKSDYYNATQFYMHISNWGAAKAVFYDIKSMLFCLRYIKKHKIQNPIIYILACRIGPFLILFSHFIKKYQCELLINPDGHEWKRGKWNKFIQFYWKLSERLSVNFADRIVCDSKVIEKYIIERYKKINTIYIPYGGDNLQESSGFAEFCDWKNANKIYSKNYYLIVGRFVPENNYETIIREFMSTNSKRDLVIITNIKHDKFYFKLKTTTHFDLDNRIKIVGAVYNQNLLNMIRKNAYGYIHGHEVGGTNPSLLESLNTTPINLLIDVAFNREVGSDGALYWTKNMANLRELIDKVDNLADTDVKEIEKRAKSRITNLYNWESIVDQYEREFVK